MLSGKENNNFSWDEHRQMVVTEDAVWNSYISSHKAADQFKHHSFPYYDQLTSIYAKDRATEKDAQIATDIVEEIDVEDVTTTNNIEEGNNYHECENDVSLDEMDVLATQLQSLKPNQDGSTFSKKKKKISDGSEKISTSITDAAMLLGENIWTVGLELSKSITSDKVLQEIAQKLYPALCEVEGLTKDEHFSALSKIPDHPMQMLIFFRLPSSVRLEWVRRFLSGL
ncbi:hypothetical protein Godav_019820 [Gossypium davidsonii]|uniref:Myb/SANT-like domain-containing protein n=1 Tax=Gossypium davidsonii TaxID=34287 RepID=A0A7J8R1T8_GOSDV|nr:hypothetical protein [Gossypium davidsonii]